MARRRQKLEDSRRWHQFNFDADGELQWIQEHMPAASSTDYGKSLIDTQNLHKKHQVGREKQMCANTYTIDLKYTWRNN